MVGKCVRFMEGDCYCMGEEVREGFGVCCDVMFIVIGCLI